MRIYMAGPLFTAAEMDFNYRLCEQLRLHGYDVFLPQEIDQSDTDLGKIFRSDVAGIDWAQLVLGNLDGADSDSGTCWELGYAYAKNKLTVVYRTDFRVGKVDIVNLMMTESANIVILMPFKSVQELAERIDHDIRDRWPDTGPQRPPVPAPTFAEVESYEPPPRTGPLSLTPLFNHEDK